MPSGVRFRPPPVDSTPELRWLLLRAFGPPEVPWAGALPVGDSGLELARRLDLSPRIGARHRREALAAEVGGETAGSFHRDRVRTVAQGLRLRALAEELAAVAAELGFALVFLKFMALELSGLLPDGGRGAADLDLLLAPEEGRRFAEALAARGFRRSQIPEMEHQLPALAAPQGGVVEIHHLLLGVRLAPGAASATAPELERAGLLAPVAELPGRCSVPVPEVLAAHALIHGLVQHGWAPHAYPALRLVADLLDLGCGGGWEAAVAGRIGGWVQAELPRAELEAILALSRRLSAGDLAPLQAQPSESGEAALLHHFLAGALNRDYRSALRLHLLGAPTDRPRLAGALGTLARALFPSRGELEALYGRRRGTLRYWGLRLVRPFDVGLRALRYAAGARRLRRRSR